MSIRIIDNEAVFDPSEIVMTRSQYDCHYKHYQVIVHNSPNAYTNFESYVREMIRIPQEKLEPGDRSRLVKHRLDVQAAYFLTRNNNPLRATDLWDIANQALKSTGVDITEDWIGKRPVLD